jgi:hypothetical protein
VDGPKADFSVGPKAVAIKFKIKLVKNGAPAELDLPARQPGGQAPFTISFPMNSEKGKAPREPNSSATHRRLYLRLFCLLAAAFLAAYLSRAWLLRSAAAFLVQEAMNPPRSYVVLWEPDEHARPSNSSTPSLIRDS